MKFVKEILTEGEYEVSTFAGPKKKKITKNDLVKYSKTTSEMIKAGIRIPAPFKHVSNGKFVSPLEEPDDSPDPSSNAGFWEKLYVRKNEHGTNSLFGVVDVPGKEDEPDTPAYKVSRTVKDTSIGLLPGFTDGKGRNWGDHAIVHIALPTDPIEPGQSNFVPLPEDEEFESIAMSRKVNTANVSQVLTLLKDRGIELPADTTNENLLDRLMVALMQSTTPGSSSLNNKPSSGKVESYPIMMSLTKKQVEAILASNLQNPETGKPFTADDLKDTPSDAETYKAAAEAMSNQLNSVYREQYQSRIKALVESGRVTQDYVDKFLIPMVNAVQMSFENNKPKQNSLDITLQALEAVPAPGGKKQDQGALDTANYMGRTPSGSTREPGGHSSDDSLDQSKVDDIINAVLKSSAITY